MCLCLENQPPSFFPPPHSSFFSSFLSRSPLVFPFRLLFILSYFSLCPSLLPLPFLPSTFTFSPRFLLPICSSLPPSLSFIPSSSSSSLPPLPPCFSFSPFSPSLLPLYSSILPSLPPSRSILLFENFRKANSALHFWESKSRLSVYLCRENLHRIILCAIAVVTIACVFSAVHVLVM